MARRPSPPRRSPPPRRMSPIQHRQPSPLPVRRPSPPPRHQSPPPRHMTPPRRMSPPPRRMSPPGRMQPPQRSPMRSGGLLGDPHDPSTQELDMLAATISNNRPSSQNSYRQEQRFQESERFQEPERFHEPVRSRTPPPPLMQSITHPPSAPANPTLHAQIQAMQVLQSEAMHKQAHQQGPSQMGGRERGRGKVNKNSFTKEEAMEEAAQMRMEEGRVLYLRYQAGAMGVIREEHLVKLAQPFEKVTNILLVAPKNLKSGWYQGFLELAHFDGAAAMCEHYMLRPPVVEGITFKVQRSKYQTLKLREDQMNRNFDKLLPVPKRNDNKRRRMSLSPERPKRNQRYFTKGRRPQSRSPKKEPQRNDKKGEDKSSRNGSSSKDNKKTQKDSKPKERKAAPVKKDREPKTESTESKNSPSGTAKNPVEKTETAKKPVEKTDEKVKVKLEPGIEAESKAQNGETKVLNLKTTDKNTERLDIIEENLEQASNMCEALLKIVQQKSTQAIINEVLEYLSDSVAQVKEIKNS